MSERALRKEREAELALTHKVGASLPPLNGSTRYVPGVGDVLSRIVLIGEAPGRDEDRLGEPFVGRAGKKVSAALEIHGIPRESVYITNVVKYRPPNNRDPLPAEIDAHFPILNREIEIIQPVGVLLLGRIALKAVVGSTHISSSRHKPLKPLSNWDTLVMATYHPSYILYGGIKEKDWQRDFENFFERALENLALHEG